MFLRSNGAKLFRRKTNVVRRFRMQRNDRSVKAGRILQCAMLAGLTGGFAEILWIALYGSLTSGSSVEVARQVTATVFQPLAAWPVAPLIGIAIHLGLSVILAVVFVRLVWIPFALSLRGGTGLLITVGTLVAVWAVNFLVVLPVVNPSFVALMPYWITLFSKALFGASMAWSLRNSYTPRLP